MIQVQRYRILVLLLGMVSSLAYSNASNPLGAQAYIDLLESSDTEQTWQKKELALEQVEKTEDTLKAINHYANEKLREGFAKGDATIQGRAWEAFLHIVVRTNSLLRAYETLEDQSQYISSEHVASFAGYICHGHNLLRLTAPDGTRTVTGYYPLRDAPYAEFNDYKAGVMKNEDYYYNDDILETCQRIVSPLTQTQYQSVKDYADSYEKSARYNFIINNCIDFVQSCFELVYPKRGFFTCYLKDIQLYSYLGALDKGAAGSILFGKGVLPTLTSLLWQKFSGAPKIVPTVWLGQSSEECAGAWQIRKYFKSVLDKKLEGSGTQECASR